MEIDGDMCSSILVNETNFEKNLMPACECI